MSNSIDGPITWERLIEAVPHLAWMEKRIRETPQPHREPYYWSRWLIYKHLMSEVVGWYAVDMPAWVVTREAWDVAHERLYRAYTDAVTEQALAVFVDDRQENTTNAP